MQGTGNGQMVEWTLDSAAMQTFDAQFRRAGSMTVSFPNGNEPPWTIGLNGSTAISNAFGRCVTDLTQRTQRAAAGRGGSREPTQPFGQAPTQPVTPEPTQPTTGADNGGDAMTTGRCLCGAIQYECDRRTKAHHCIAIATAAGGRRRRR